MEGRGRARIQVLRADRRRAQRRFTLATQRRGDLRSPDGNFESRPLARAGAGPGVEAYELHLGGQASHVSEPHSAGTRELIVVLAGELRMAVCTEIYDLGVGDSLAFSADQDHMYENPADSSSRMRPV